MELESVNFISICKMHFNLDKNSALKNPIFVVFITSIYCTSTLSFALNRPSAIRPFKAKVV